MKKITQFFIKRNDNNKEIDTEKGNDGDSEKYKFWENFSWRSNEKNSNFSK